MKYLRKKVIFIISIIIIMLSTQLSICQGYKNNFLNKENDLPYDKWSDNWKLDEEIPAGICITPGENESIIKFSWYSKETDKPSKLKFYCGNNEENIEVNRINIGNGFISNKAEINNLKSNTEYYYKYTIDDEWSKKIKINIRDDNKYSFIFMGDPQIGASYKYKKMSSYKEAIKIDTYNWNYVLKVSLDKAEKCSFILCGGDETNTINNYSDREKERISSDEFCGFLYPKYLRHIPIVNVIGNHDKDNIDFYYHFNNPNMSEFGRNKAGGDYYFKYNNTLFLILNTNNLNIYEHEKFIEDTISKYSNIVWKVVAFHHDIYGGGDHSKDKDVEYLRNNLPNILERNKIDLVFNGHDHIYSRSNSINGIVYITGGSSTGSKFYKENREKSEYINIKFDKEVATYTIVNVSSDKININTYRVDNKEKIDSYCIFRN